jgi:predicted Rossmann-fold nucleotide-binding protein
LSWLDTAINEGFIRESNRKLLLVCDDVDSVLDEIHHHHVEDGVRYDMKWDDAAKSVDELI